jgi:tRNA (guanine37-N1)-methyltransferase
MSQQTKTEAYALKVPKKQGEKSIHLVDSLGLFNKNLKIVPEKDSLLIPMVKKPDSGHVEKIRKDFVSFEIVIHEFVVQAKHLKSALDVAAERLPPNLRASFPHAIDFMGKIAVIEIPAELAEYKTVVGEAILEAHKNVRTVLAKSSAVEGIYRLREYEVIAGLHNTETIHREHGCMYYVDLSKVYFSPRLSHEHQRVALQVTENETVIDMFAGVGPFSVLIAKLRNDIKVYAVDVNSDAVRFLEKNVTANNVLGKVVPVLGDARKVVKGKLLGTADRVIMNLPEKAEEYVDVACEAIKPEGGVIHYYEFSEGANATEIAKKHLTEAVSKTGRNIGEFLSARIVREVAPFKWQVVIDATVH